MNDNLQFNDACINLVTSSEGWSNTPYVDPASGGEPITIGFGSTHYEDGTKVTMNDAPIDKEKGRSMMCAELNKIVAPIINKLVKVELNANQYGALGSLIYNIGSGNFANSSVLKAINEESGEDEIRNDWEKWNKASGKVMKGLINRRANELTLYFS